MNLIRLVLSLAILATFAAPSVGADSGKTNNGARTGTFTITFQGQ